MANQTRKLNKKTSSRNILPTSGGHICKSGSSERTDIYSQGTATIDISSLKTFNEKEYIEKMRNHLFQSGELAQLNKLSQVIKFESESTNPTELLCELSFAIKEFAQEYNSDLFDNNSDPDKIFIKQSYEKLDITPATIMFLPLYDMLKKITSMKLKYGFLYCLQQIIGKDIYLVEMLEGEYIYEQQFDWHQGMEPEADKEVKQYLKFMETHYGHTSRFAKFAMNLRAKRYQFKVEYFDKKPFFNNKWNSFAFDLCKQMLVVARNQHNLLELDVSYSMDSNDNDERYTRWTELIGICWKNDMYLDQHIEHLNANGQETELTEVSEFFEVNSEGIQKTSLKEYALELKKMFHQLCTLAYDNDKDLLTRKNKRSNRK